MSTAQITELRDSFGKLERMDPNGMVYRRLCSILDNADNASLRAIYRANIPFVSSLARNRMIKRGVKVQ